jgi:long-chain acyl-CoA synthetase
MERKFDAEESLELIEREKISWMPTVPTVLIRWLALPDEAQRKFDLSSMRVVQVTGAPCPVTVKKGINEFFMRQGAPVPVFHEHYGSADVSTITVLYPEDYLADPRRYASVGRACVGDFKIINDEGRECKPGENGTVYSRSLTSIGMISVGAEEAVKDGFRMIDGKEWYDDGVIGHADEAGFLYLTGRKKEMIITGGVNIFPPEIEEVIFKHPKVADVTVIDVPDPDLGEVAGAIVQPKGEEKVTEEEIIEYCKKEGLYGYKIPKKVEFVEELPRRVDGKILKRELRERYWKGVERRG